MNLTTEQLHTLRHMLGINTPYDRIPKPYRNYAAVNPGDPEYVELERLGAVRRAGKTVGGQYDYYECTEDGKAAAIESHRGIQHSKAKRRYGAFLDLKDCIPDLTFRDFLTQPDFKTIRDDA